MNSVNTSHAATQELSHRSELHLSRKVWHISTGLIGLSLFHRYGNQSSIMMWAGVIFAVGIGGLLFDFARLRIPRLNLFILKWAKALYRKSEAETLSGLPFYALGVALALAIFPFKMAILGIWFLILADPCCSLIGVLYGKHKTVPHKTLEGSAAGFVMCFSITFIFLYLERGQADFLTSFLFALLAGLIGSFSELLSTTGIDDNLTIPIVSAGGLSVLNLLIPIL